MSQRDTFGRLIESLNRSILDDRHWPATSGLIDAACGTTGNRLVVGTDTADGVQLDFVSFNQRGERRADLERLYFERYYGIDERVPRLRRLADGQLAHVRSLYTERERKASVTYNEVVLPHGLGDSLNVRLHGPAGLRLAFLVGNTVEPGGWTSTQIDTVRAVVPHVRQFARVRQALATARALGSSMAELLHTNGIGIAELDRRGRIGACNDLARGLLRRADGLRDEDRFLRAALPADDARLQRVLASALPAAGSPAVGGATSMARPSQGPPLVVSVTPVAARDDGWLGCAAALVLVETAERHPPRIAPRRLGAALGLSPEQARLAVAVAQGRSVRDIAEAAGSTENAVRMRLKRIYRRAGVPGQPALVRLVLSAADVVTWGS